MLPELYIVVAPAPVDALFDTLADFQCFIDAVAASAAAAVAAAAKTTVFPLFITTACAARIVQTRAVIFYGDSFYVRRVFREFECREASC